MCISAHLSPGSGPGTALRSSPCVFFSQHSGEGRPLAFTAADGATEAQKVLMTCPQAHS